jgi:hypothetical protein
MFASLFFAVVHLIHTVSLFPGLPPPCGLGVMCG